MKRIALAIRQIGIGSTIAVAVFLASVAYAFLAKATYRTAAAVAVEFPRGFKPLPATEAKRRLERAVLEPAQLESLARDAGGPTGKAPLDLRKSADISTTDGRVFKVAFSDASPERARRMANALARRASEQAPAALFSPVLRASDPKLEGTGLKAHVLADAPLPKTPVSPNRRRVMLIGWLAGLIVALGAWFFGGILRRLSSPTRRPGTAVSSHPPRTGTPAPTPMAAPNQPFTNAERRVVSDIPTLIGSSTTPLELAVASFAAERARATGESAIELPPPTPKVFPELAQALEAWRSSSKIPAAPQHKSSPPGGTASPAAYAATELAVSPIRPETPPPPAEVPAPPPLSEAPPSRPRRRRAGSGGTLLMGSFAPPTDGRDRAAPLSTRPPVAETTYRYSTAPPGPQPGEPKQEKPNVNVLRAAPGWIPDQTLILPLHKDLREQLYACALNQCFTVVITGSPDTAAIKSRVACGLALALADTGHPRILLMEANFHHPSVHRLMHVDVPVSAGFSQQLHSRIHLESDKPWSVVGCSETLHVLAEGLMRSPGMILSKQFERSLRDLQKYYDLIVIDGPDTSFEFDCRALDSLADGVALVCTNPESPEVQQDQALFTNKRFSTVISVIP